MTIATRLAIFAAGLVGAFAAAWGVGSTVAPVLDEPIAAHEMDAGDHDDH